ncbi:hypothetical protein V8C42DRAFT_87029 [Trichoderma barbatum]
MEFFRGCGCGCSVCFAATRLSGQTKRDSGCSWLFSFPASFRRCCACRNPPYHSVQNTLCSTRASHASVERKCSCNRQIRAGWPGLGSVIPPSSHPPSPGYNKPWQPSHRTPVPGTHIAAVTSTPVQMHFTGMKGNRRHLPARTTHNVAARPFCRL